jgi:DNA-binding MarR family transcriptional regulator
MPRSAPPFVLDDFLPYRLSVVTNRVSRVFARRYAQAFDLSIPEWRVMAVLGSYQPLTANQVGDLTAMDKVKVSRAVARLAAMKRLTRTPSPEDQRAALLALSAEGCRVYERIVPLARGLEAELMEGLEPGDRARLLAILGRLDARVGRLGGSA